MLTPMDEKNPAPVGRWFSPLQSHDCLMLFIVLPPLVPHLIGIHIIPAKSNC